MRIGLIDVDSHNFPNLALMKISSYRKSKGDVVEWWLGDLFHYDIVYMSKVFSQTYSEDILPPINSELVVQGGTGYCIETNNGKEIYHKKNDVSLANEVEHSFPDYSLYPKYDFALSMTTRGCPRKCGFCHVSAKEGCKTIKVSNVNEYWCGQHLIKVLDANITACDEKYKLYEQYIQTGAEIDFTQGLDIRLTEKEDIAFFNNMKIKQVHFAWDNPKQDLTDKFSSFAENFNKKDKGMVYVLVNYNSSKDEDLYRIYTLNKLGYKPYVMIYDKPNASLYHRRLQGWCNNKILFNCTPKFDDVRWVGETLNIRRKVNE